MPLDYRRFNGPEDSISYKRFTEAYVKSYDQLHQDFLNENGVRKDGRNLEEARQMFATLDIVSQAKGSAFIEFKHTKVVCSVFDPREIPHQNEFSQLGQIYCEVKFAPFSCPRKRRPYAPDAEERALSVALRKALEPTVCTHLFPNFQIDVFVYILEHDGACLATVINAAGFALVSAAVPVYDVITAFTVAIIDGKMVLDPTESEEHLATISPETQTNHGVITMSILPQLNQITNFQQIGSLDIDCTTKAMEFLDIACRSAVPYFQDILRLHVIRCHEEQLMLKEEEKEREEMLNKKMEEWKLLLNAE